LPGGQERLRHPAADGERDTLRICRARVDDADNLAVRIEQRSTAVAGVHGSIRLNQPRARLTLYGDRPVEATDGTLSEGDRQPFGETHRGYRSPNDRRSLLNGEDVPRQRLVKPDQRHVTAAVNAHDAPDPGVAAGGHAYDGCSIDHVRCRRNKVRSDEESSSDG
jgi:hypothetical protein